MRFWQAGSIEMTKIWNASCIKAATGQNGASQVLFSRSRWHDKHDPKHNCIGVIREALQAWSDSGMPHAM